jgi:large subunit ribosomal protein L23
MRQIIKKPLISEKNTTHNSMGVYVFEVDIKADKLEIKKNVETFFNVKVQSVKTSVCRGRAKNTKFGPGQIPRWKKAFVKLRSGEKIALFEGV